MPPNPAKGMEFAALIDRIEDVVGSGKRSRVDKKELSALVAQLRGSIPEELTQARWISEKREEMLAEARQETERILEEAREERARLLGREEVEQRAEQRAEQVADQAEASADQIRVEAEAYAISILDGLETYLSKLVGAVERGRSKLAERGDRFVERSGDGAAERGRDRERALVA